MDLTGRTAGYRGMAIRCPGCGASMSTEHLSDAEIDECGACGGLWLDWFDGEVRALAAAALASEASRAVERASSVTDDGRSSMAEATATGACPRCTLQLTSEEFVVRGLDVRAGEDARRTAQSTGAEVLRCDGCAGVFVTRATAEVLAKVDAADPPPESAAATRFAPPLPWGRLLAVLRRWARGFGMA
jgi:Zn-finger nucleic acid-binding protein